MKGRIKVVAKSDPVKVDVYFSDEKDANSLSRYWATVEGGEVSESSNCKYKVLLNYHTGTEAFPHIKLLPSKRSCRSLDGYF